MINTDRIRQQSDIVQVISSYVEIAETRNGEPWWNCPFHTEDTPSMHIQKGKQFFKCFGCQEKGDVFNFVQKIEGGISFVEAAERIADICGISSVQGDNSQPVATPSPKPKEKTPGRIVRSYDYTDEAGNPLYQVCRMEPKGFRQRRYVNGGWAWGLKDARIVPYRLPQIIAASAVMIVEGEKDVESIESFGAVATCNSGGAGKWRPEFNALLRGKRICILPDNDLPGRKHALAVAAGLIGVAESVRLVELSGGSGGSGGKDVTDWIETGGTKETLQTICRETPDLTVDTLADQARAWGLETYVPDTPLLDTDAPPSADAADVAPETVVDLLPQMLSDYGNGQRLIALKGEVMRYCDAIKCWLLWDGSRWVSDVAKANSGQARLAAQNTMIEFLRQATAKRMEARINFARGSLNSRRISSVLTEATPHLTILPSILDTDPWLLNFKNGTLDLRTGKLRDHSKEDYITRVLDYDYRPGAECPVFLRFLLGCMGDTPDASDPIRAQADESVAFLQRALGYSLTGSTREKVLFLLVGGTDHGKSTLLDAFRKLLKEYGQMLQIDSLMANGDTSNNNVQADLADLRGARFVQSSETEEGQRLGEARIKGLTQGTGFIKATRKFENPIEFPETHKLWIDANHLPAIRGTDNSIWNRFIVVPFDIKPEVIDRELPAKFAAEGEGILAWAVAGALEWQRDGLRVPRHLDKAKGVWREDMDQIGRFIREKCVVAENTVCQASQLYSTYTSWTKEWNEFCFGNQAFSKKLIERGFKRERRSFGTLYDGIGIKADAGKYPDPVVAEPGAVQGVLQ